MENLKKIRIISNLTQECLAKKLNIDTFSVSRYESELSFPNLQILLKLINIFNVSLDFLILYKKCFYPKNIKFLKLAKKIDNLNDSNIRTNVEVSTSAFLKKNTSKNITIKQDNIEIKLLNIFHLNLKNIRKYRGIRQVDFAKTLNISTPLLGMYEKKVFPSIAKLIKISESINISMHALTTGEKLFFDFEDRPFGRTMLLADHYLSLEHQKFLIELMENIINKIKNKGENYV